MIDLPRILLPGEWRVFLAFIEDLEVTDWDMTGSACKSQAVAWSSGKR